MTIERTHTETPDPPNRDLFPATWVVAIGTAVSAIMSVVIWFDGRNGTAQLFAVVAVGAGAMLLILAWRARQTAIAVIAALSIAGGSAFTWETWRAGERDLARIVTPTDGEQGGLCPIVRGIAPAVHGDESYWLGIQGEGMGADGTYLIGRIDGDRADAPLWDLGRPGLGAFSQVGQRFELILIHTDGDRTRELGEHLRGYFTLQDDEIAHKIEVTQTAEPACPGRSKG